MIKCRHCGHQTSHVFLDLGTQPPSNAYLEAEDLSKQEPHFPLKTYVCDQCFLVQTMDFTQADELFDQNYAYFSSTSQSWLAHAKAYSEMIIAQLALGADDFVIEIASNDGYLLKNFVERQIPCLGIEPTQSTADAARHLGVPVRQAFFGVSLAKDLVEEEQQADLIIGNNVYAHVPDINDFTKGLKLALKAQGTITLEFPHLMNLIAQNQFDTIYHEHFSYLSLTTIVKIFDAHGLVIWNVEELTTHGGSLRIYAGHQEADKDIEPNVDRLLERERAFGLLDLSCYGQMSENAKRAADDLRVFLLNAKKDGKKVAAYGAAAKGNTLLNYAGIGSGLLPIVYDAAPSKQGKFLPGSHIPIVAPDQILQDKPDYLLILPWNIAPEIIKAQTDKGFKGTFVTAIPELKIHS